MGGDLVCINNVQFDCKKKKDLQNMQIICDNSDL